MIIPKKEEQKAPALKDGSLSVSNLQAEEDVIKALELLDTDKRRLVEQKEHLYALLKQLETRGKEEVEIRKRNLQKLTQEVSALKSKCEKYSQLIASDSSMERTATV